MLVTNSHILLQAAALLQNRPCLNAVRTFFHDIHPC